MIKKIKASTSEKIIFIFVLLLGLFSLSSFLLLKDKCLFVKNYDPKKINFKDPNNIAILNVGCGNVIIELYPEVSPNGVERFKTLIKSKAYDDVAFHRVIKLIPKLIKNLIILKAVLVWPELKNTIQKIVNFLLFYRMNLFMKVNILQ